MRFISASNNLEFLNSRYLVLRLSRLYKRYDFSSYRFSFFRHGFGEPHSNQVTVITSAPSFPQGALFEGYQNHWHRSEGISGIKVVRVKTYISANRGVLRRSLDFLSFGVTSFVAGLFQPRPNIVATTSLRFFAAGAGCLRKTQRPGQHSFSIGRRRCRA
jgi:hypothetical protein